jgi:hypothetical protein
MKSEIDGQVFKGGLVTRGFSDLLLSECVFHGCRIGVPLIDPEAPFHLHRHDLSRRPVLRNIEARRCELRGGNFGCALTAAVVEEVVLDDLMTDGLVQTWATVFNHVTLKGKIDRLMFSPFFSAEESPYFAPGKPPSKFRQALDKANSDYYATVDWAIDIRDAEFKDFDCRGVPSRLVRRDPETQIMVTRERVLACGDAIAAGGTYWHGWLKLFLQDDFYNDAVLIAFKRSPKFKDLLAGIHQLRRAGVAEPD